MKIWTKQEVQEFDFYQGNIPNPNCCSRRTPIKIRLSMFASRWMMPACNQIHVTSLHPWWPCTVLAPSRAPSLYNLQKDGKYFKLINPIFSIQDQLYSLTGVLWIQILDLNLQENYNENKIRISAAQLTAKGSRGSREDHVIQNREWIGIKWPEAD